MPPGAHTPALAQPYRPWWQHRRHSWRSRGLPTSELFGPLRHIEALDKLASPIEAAARVATSIKDGFRLLHGAGHKRYLSLRRITSIVIAIDFPDTKQWVDCLADCFLRPVAMCCCGEIRCAPSSSASASGAVTCRSRTGSSTPASPDHTNRRSSAASEAMATFCSVMLPAAPKLNTVSALTCLAAAITSAKLS